MRSGTISLAAVTLLFAAITAYWTLRDSPEPEAPTTEAEPTDPTPVIRDTLDKNRALSRGRSSTREAATGDELPPFAKDGERIATFDSDEAYQKFLASLKNRGLRLLSKSDRMRAIRFGFSYGYDLSELDDLNLAYNYIVSIPPPPDASAQPGAASFGGNALAWLGVTGDNSAWGRGITVAVLDSGVTDHIAFNQQNGKVTQIALTEIDADAQLSHGTAVTSIITGDHPLTPGVAPAADILSIRITDSSGSSDSFTLAEGIYQAVDAGAKIINISMGSYGDSGVVKNAVDYAQKNGSVIVASSGNAGLDAIAYPAAYPGVVAVGAVEARGKHLDFSNTGQNLAVTAPGMGVNAAWGTEQLTSFSGTSASAPFISGAIAATMSEKNITATQATQLVLENANEAGFPGTDEAYGNGNLDLGRIMQSSTPGIYDAAVASQVIVPPAAEPGLPQVLVTVENRGTETLINTPLTVQTASGNQLVNISSLAPGAIYTYRVTVPPPAGENPVVVSSSVQTNEPDLKNSNNAQTSEFFAQPEP